MDIFKSCLNFISSIFVGDFKNIFIILLKLIVDYYQKRIIKTG